MNTQARLDIYLRDRSKLTPAQRRRVLKKLHREGAPEKEAEE